MAFQERRRVLFVQYLPPDVQQKELIGLFERYGPVFNVSVNRKTATIQFENPGDAKTAIGGLDGVDFKGRRIRVSFSMDNQNAPLEGSLRAWHGGRKGGSRNTNQVYVAPLGLDATKSDVLHFAWKGGSSVVFVDLITTEKFNVGHFQYAVKDDYDYALEWLDGTQYNGKEVRVFAEEDFKRLFPEQMSKSKR